MQKENFNRRIKKPSLRQVDQKVLDARQSVPREPQRTQAVREDSRGADNAADDLFQQPAKVSAGGMKSWPAEERPRERLNRYGAGALSDAQLIAILLRTGRRKRTAFDLACDLLNTVGGMG